MQTESLSRTRLVIVTTHPIQYHAPWFRALANESSLDLQVWFCHKATPQEQAQAGFGVEFDWDMSLLDGYQHRFLKNVSSQPGVNTYAGLDTPELGELIQRESPDVVLINGWHYKSAWQALRTCWRTRRPVMVRSDSHLHSPRSATKKIAKWPYYRWFIPKLDACLAVGSWSRDYFLHYGARADRIFTVPHVIDTEYFLNESAKLRPQRERIRRELQLAPDSVVFLFAGKFIDKKRPMDFIHSIELAHHKEGRIGGLMVGDGSLKQSCEEYVRTRSLPISFTGFLNQSRIVEGYVAADALILPSDGGETWGLVVNEAMTSGLPCFVSDHVGCGADLVTNNENGAVFPLGDFEKITQLVIEFARDDDRREALSQNARRAVDKSSASAAVSGTLEAIASITGVTV